MTQSGHGTLDVQTALMNVRFEKNNGHDADVTRCPLMTQSRHIGRPPCQYHTDGDAGSGVTRLDRKNAPTHADIDHV